MPNPITTAATFYQENEINPGIHADEDKKKKIAELSKLIHDASFIPKKSEKNWLALLPYFTKNFLEELKQTIIRESLRHLSTKNKRNIK